MRNLQSSSFFPNLQCLNFSWLTSEIWKSNAKIRCTAVTKFRLKAYPYTQSIFAGPIYLPKTALSEVAQAVADFTQRSHDKKLGMFLYVLKKELLASMGGGEDKIILHAFDAHGEEHGRSDEGFGWALKLKDAEDKTSTMNLKGVADLQGETHSLASSIVTQLLTVKTDKIGEAKGLTNSYWSPVALPELTKEIVTRSFDWYDSVCDEDGSIGDNAYLIFEIMQKVTKFTPNTK